jgi:hypothetical protein
VAAAVAAAAVVAVAAPVPGMKIALELRVVLITFVPLVAQLD